MGKFIIFCKKEIVLITSILLAVGSMILVPPDSLYIGYIDVRVLALLFCLMAVVGSAKEQGLFRKLSKKALEKVNNIRVAAIVIIVITFFSSVLITNDVALITFVPLAVIVFTNESEANLITVVVMQTIAANIGSAVTPVGNPQNLFLSGYYNLSAGQFVKLTVPFAVIGFLLIICCSFIKIKPHPVITATEEDSTHISVKKALVCFALFVLCVASVLHFVNFWFALVAVCLGLCVTDRKAFRNVDVSLLLTFVFLFIFVGNIARVDVVREALEACIKGRALIVSALASQFISNVPAALLLSGFTNDGAALVIGTNVGGLGTPIASMASLISLRIYQTRKNANSKRYIAVFSVYNFAFLAVLLFAEFFIN